jgi:hypothetical protein
LSRGRPKASWKAHSYRFAASYVGSSTLDGPKGVGCPL